jgi:hypothetical protein
MMPISVASVGSSYHRSSANNVFESRWGYQYELGFIELFPLYSSYWPAILRMIRQRQAHLTTDQL